MTSIFKPVNDDIKLLAEKYPNKIDSLKNIFDKETVIYIDYANVVGNFSKRRWNLDLKRTKDLLDSFETIKEIKFFYGLIDNSHYSVKVNEEAKNNGYTTFSKPVKNIKIYFDISSIPLDSTRYIREFIKRPLIQKLTVNDIQLINNMLKNLNDS